MVDPEIKDPNINAAKTKGEDNDLNEEVSAEKGKENTTEANPKDERKASEKCKNKRNTDPSQNKTIKIIKIKMKIIKMKMIQSQRLVMKRTLTLTIIKRKEKRIVTFGNSVKEKLTTLK